MVTASCIAVSVKTFFVMLFFVMVAAYVHLFIFGEYSACFAVTSRWYMLIVADFASCFLLIGLWIAYKESSWIIAVAIVAVMYFVGSLLTIGYILTQFYILSQEEALNDPLHFVLARRRNRDVRGGPSASAVALRVIFSSLGCLVLGAMIYTLLADLSPSYTNGFSSCIIANLTDLYIHILIYSVWIAYKEASWVSAFFWIVLLLCFRGVALCAYVVRELSYLSPNQPAFLIIFNNTNRDLQSADPLLLAHPNDV